MELFYHLRLADGSYEEVPMGIFEVSEANRTAYFLKLKVYDHILRFERDFNGFESVGTAYDFMGLCAKACGVGLAQTAAKIGAMPNGSEVMSIYSGRAWSMASEACVCWEANFGSTHSFLMNGQNLPIM